MFSKSNHTTQAGQPSRSSHRLWVNQAQRVLSFHQEDGFQPMSFLSHDALMAFVLEHVAYGYRIQ